MWYEWRMTLLATLKDGFFKTAEAMVKDEKVLGRQQKLLDSVLPQLLQHAKQLSIQEEDLQVVAEELANCDQEELSDTRQQLITLDADIESKKQMIADLKKQLEGREVEIAAGIQRREICLDDIREAEKVREECRGWSSSEISALKGICHYLSKKIQLIFYSQSGCDRERTWLDHYWGLRHHDIHDLPQRNRARFRRCFISVRDSKVKAAFQLPNRPLVHRC